MRARWGPRPSRVTLPLVAAGLAACGGTVGAHDEAFAPAGLAAARQAVQAAVDAGEIPGAVLFVGRGDQLLLCEAFGRRALEPEPEPMTVDTLFDLASLTKPVAAAASVMKLVEEGRVALDAPAARYLPEFGVAGKEAITVETLLRHWGGLVPDNPLGDYAGAPGEAWDAICALAPETPPGTAFAYTDVGYIVLGELVRRVDGRALDVFAEEELFAPLGMTDTLFRPDPERATRAAPTERLPNGRCLRGVVHDPRARALGGVAGHAGLFSTADDLARFCRMVLGGGELEGTPVLAEETVALWTRARWLPDGTGGRALGFDVDSPYASARGDVFPRGASFGHTGFTGTSLWLDPASGAYVILLTNRVHPDGGGSVVELRRAVATAVGRALVPAPTPRVLAGADVLADEGCARLAGRRVALLTHAAGRTRAGGRTVDLLWRAPQVELVAVLTPEHGYGSNLEGEVEHGRDAATGLPVHSLYGETRRPTADMLAGVDALVVDLQDVGVRFYTYASTLGLAMEAAGEQGVTVVVLDRPSPLAAWGARGPLADEARLSFIAHRPLPVLSGLTLGELARLYRDHYGVRCALEVVPCQGWRRAMGWEETGLPWIPPSPNLRNPTQAVLYPAIGLLEGANLSVGRGTDEPFERLGAPWIDGVALAATLNAAGVPGLAFAPLEFTPAAGPFAGQACGGVAVALTERAAYRPVEAGLTLAWHLKALFPRALEVERVDARMLSHDTWEAWMRSTDPRDLPATWRDDLQAFEAAAAAARLYE